MLRVGAGTGLTSGIGSPQARVVTQISWARPSEGDADGDGLLDATDRCPDRAEDFDNFEDTDGCPEAETPVQVVIRDPYIGLVENAKVEITGETTAKSGNNSFSVTLEPGNYQIAASAPNYHPIDDYFTVEMGQSAQVVKVMTPFAEPARITVTKERIRIAEKVYFNTNAAEIRSQSYDLLNEIARTLEAHPEIVRIRIEGHTDSRGDAGYNLELSRKRATAVMTYLVQVGVDERRLAAAGYGEDQPIDPRELETAWEINRRVEFIIEERSN